MSCLFLSRTFHEREKIEEVSLQENKTYFDLIILLQVFQNLAFSFLTVK